METIVTHKPIGKYIHFSWSGFAKFCRVSAQCSVLMTLTVGLIACGGGQDDDLKVYVDQIKARAKGRIPPLPEPQSFEIFSYQDINLRDPFVPSEVVEAAANAKSGPRPDKSRVKDVLEQFALGSLKMMGSVEKDGKRWALVKAADGTLYRTTKGRHMGQNNGEIIRITENELELKEIVPDGLGGYIERFSTLAANE